VRGLRPEIVVSRAARVALATCAAFPDGDADDAGLPAAIGGDVTFAVWDDPVVDWAAFDLVVVRSTWDYQERRDAFLAWAREIGDRLVNPPGVLAWNTDKRYLHELAAAGLPVVPTTLVAPGSPFTPPAGEYVVKPTVSAGSRDTARFTDGEDGRAIALVAAIHASGRTAMVQPYVASVDARGETALLFFDGTFSHAIHKGPLLRPGAEPTSEVFAAETIEPRTPTDAERAVAQRVVDDAAQRLGTGPPLYARIDLVEDRNGAPLLLELELTEPSLFFAGDTARLGRFAAAVQRRLASA
jgi:glutathione synthase/RimK-type ligase-like ATP-grasp enzyme